MRSGIRVAMLAVTVMVGATQAAQLPELVTPEIDSSVQRGLKFLASRQRNGTWAAEGQASYTVYHTALCGTVLLQSGSTPHEGPYAEHIMKATTFLMGACQPDGFLSVADGTGREMYGHGMAMLFLWRDANWAAYYRQESRHLLATQRKDGTWFTRNMGDVYGTGMALYFLQLPYKQLPILQQ